MNSANAPLLTRLILLVLVLNLICVALLVFRAYQRPIPVAQGPDPAAPAAAAVQEAVEVSAPAPRAPRPSTGDNLPHATVRPVVVTQAQRPPVTTVPDASDPVLPLPAPTPTAPLVNLGATREGGAPLPQTGATTGDGPDLSGRVTLLGVPNPELRIDFGPACGRLRTGPATTRHFVVGPEGGLANVLVWLKNAHPSPPLVQPPELNQAGCMFEPYVLAVVAGQKFRVRNSDPTLHNLHFTPAKNHEINLGQTFQGQVNELAFRSPELSVRLKCDVHPWMFSYVHVLEHPYFAITDTNGFYRLPAGFPAGRYLVAARHLKAGEVAQQIDLPAGEQRILNFELAVANKLEARSR